MKLYLDVETRSHCDLLKSGAYVYAEHPTTQVIVVCYAWGDAPVETWFPLTEPMPDDLAAAFTDPSITLVAHNAAFERTVCLVARLRAPLPRWNCTAARAAAMGLPRTLEGAAAALDLPVQKDAEGRRLMLKMCKPLPVNKKTGVGGGWFGGPAEFARLAAYCRTDVEVERALDRVLPELSPFEHRTWQTTEKMNDRGVRVDTAALLALILLTDDAIRDVSARIASATGGAVPAISNHAALTKWLDAQGFSDEPVEGVGKAALAAMLENPDLPNIVREVLIMRRDGGGSSSRKFSAILKRLSNDGRIRGVLVYAGAAATRRWSSRGAQLQNIPRGGSVKDVEAALRDVLAGATLDELTDMWGPPLVVASELIRPVFVA